MFFSAHVSVACGGSGASSYTDDIVEVQDAYFAQLADAMANVETGTDEAFVALRAVAVEWEAAIAGLEPSDQYRAAHDDYASALAESAAVLVCADENGCTDQAFASFAEAATAMYEACVNLQTVLEPEGRLRCE
jgi:hypothetical protein